MMEVSYLPEAIIIVLTVTILVVATWILHSSLKTQNATLKQQLLLMAARVADDKAMADEFKRRAEATQIDLMAQVTEANRRAELLRDSLARIGINPDLLESTGREDDLWRIAALGLIVVRCDESRIADGTNKESTILFAHRLIGAVCA